MGIKEDQEAQKIINQIDLSSENINDEIYDLFLLSENNIIAKQYIKKHQNTIFEKRPDLLLICDDNEIVQDFVDNLHNNKEQYDIIKNGLKKYLKANPQEISSNLNTPILELYSKDLLKDKEFRTLLDNTLKQPRNNKYFLSPKYENNSIIKNFVENNPEHINQILTDNLSYINDYKDSIVVREYKRAQEIIEKIDLSVENINDEIFYLPKLSEFNIFAKQYIKQNQNTIFEKRPDLLLAYETTEIVQKFTNSLEKNSEQYNNIKNALKQYFKDNPEEVTYCLDTPITKLYSEDLLADQEFKTSLNNNLRKTINNWFFLDKRFEKNSIIKDFVEKNPEYINKILTDNPSYINNYKDSIVVKQYGLQKLKENAILLGRTDQDLSNILLSNSQSKGLK